MAFWKLEQLKRWFDRTPDDGKGEPGDVPEGDEEDGPEGDGGEGEPGDDEGEGEPGEGEGEPGEGDGKGAGKGKGGQPGDAPGEGDGEGEEATEGGEDGPESDGKGGGGQGTGGGKPLDPRDFQNLDGIKPEDIRDPDVTVRNEEGESSTPTAADKLGKKPVVIIDPVEFPIGPMTQAYGTQSVQAWAKQLKAMRVGALRLTLRRLMQKSDYAGREGGLRSGRLTGRGVTRLLMGGENVFERRYEVEGESVAVSLLIDRSGSMSGPKMEQAATVALLIGETASNAKAKLEVIAFDSSYDKETRTALERSLADEAKVDVVMGRESRWMYADASAVYVCKTFGQHIGQLRRMYTTMRNMASGGTNDASALDWVGKRLLKQSANRKIVFVIADGSGDRTETFRHVVESLEKKGVIVIGIGIGCIPSVFNKRFTYATCINDPAELCSKAFGMLIGTIAKAKGFA